MFLEGVLTVSVWTFIWVWVCVCVCVCVTVCASLCGERVVCVSLCGHPWRDWGAYGCVWRKGCVGAGRNRCICVEMAVCVWMERQMTESSQIPSHEGEVYFSMSLPYLATS